MIVLKRHNHTRPISFKISPACVSLVPLSVRYALNRNEAPHLNLKEDPIFGGYGSQNTIAARLGYDTPLALRCVHLREEAQ